MVLVSMILFQIAATAFLVVLTLSFFVFAVKYIRTRPKGRGPFGMFSQPRHTFAQYDDDESEGGAGMDTEGDGAKPGRGDQRKSG